MPNWGWPSSQDSVIFRQSIVWWLSAVCSEKAGLCREDGRRVARVSRGVLWDWGRVRSRVSKIVMYDFIYYMMY